MALKTEYYEPFKGAGVMYLRKYGAAEALAMVGNCNNVKFATEVDEQDLTDYMTSAGGTYASDARIKSCTVSFDGYDWNTENLVRALGAEATSVTPAAATETHTAYIGGLIMLAGLNPSGVTVVNNTTPATTYAEGTDYEVRPEGIYILNGAISDGTDIDITPTAFTNHDLIEALLTTGNQYELVFAGVNGAMSDRSLVTKAYKVKFNPSEIDLISDSFTPITFSGKVLQDATVTGTGKSKYFKQIKQSAA